MILVVLFATHGVVEEVPAKDKMTAVAHPAIAEADVLFVAVVVINAKVGVKEEETLLIAPQGDKNIEVCLGANVAVAGHETGGDLSGLRAVCGGHRGFADRTEEEDYNQQTESRMKLTAHGAP
jgi:hypothetical protein